MSEEKKDLGLGDKHSANQKRLVNKEGTFNAKKIGAVKGFRDMYQHLVTIPWPKFFLLIVLSYLALNLFFGTLYYIIGVENLQGLTKTSTNNDFLNCFYFSTQTFTTVGYGAIYPTGVWANLVASFEAMVGLLSFALATGLLFGRFSKPNAKFIWSHNILISPYKEDHQGLMFRVVNKRDNALLDASAVVTLIYYYIDEKGIEKRGFSRLDLELSEIRMFPTSWTIVHPIKEGSPFFDKTEKELKNFRFEVIVLIKAFDETFGQDVYARTSYTDQELVYKAKFVPSFEINEQGETIVDLNTIGDYNIVESFSV